MLVNLSEYRFNRRIDLLMVRSDGEEYSDYNLMSNYPEVSADVVLCHNVNVTSFLLFDKYDKGYKYSEVIHYGNDTATLLFSIYPIVIKHKAVSSKDHEVVITVCTLGPGGEGLTITYISGDILVSITNLSDVLIDGKNEGMNLYLDTGCTIFSGVSDMVLENECELYADDHMVLYHYSL
jgi:hypothetical protein